MQNWILSKNSVDSAFGDFVLSVESNSSTMEYSNYSITFVTAVLEQSGKLILLSKHSLYIYDFSNR